MKAKENKNGVIIAEVTGEFLIEQALNSGYGSIQIEKVGAGKFLTFLTSVENTNGKAQQIKLVCKLANLAAKVL
jgi:hypothetical protein